MKTRIAVAALIVLGASLAGCMGDSVSPVDNTPPAAPQGLTIVRGPVTSTLEWQANTEADLAGYQVYRASVNVGETSGTTQLTSSAITTPEYVIDMLPGNWQYTVRAVDTDGHLSAPASVIVTLSNPTTDVQQPDEGTRSGKRGE
jgi:predicted phage tail protein